MSEFDNYVALYILLAAQIETRVMINNNVTDTQCELKTEKLLCEGENPGPPPAPLSGNILDDPELLWAEVILRHNYIVYSIT
jgi:hypothetical protein